MQGRAIPPPSGSVVCWGQLKYSGCHRSSLDFARFVLTMMVLRFRANVANIVVGVMSILMPCIYFLTTVL